MNSPCKDFTERAVGCRIKCEKWATFVKAQEAEYRLRKIYSDLAGYRGVRIAARKHKDHRNRRK